MSGRYTYISIKKETLYLSINIDTFSRKIVDWFDCTYLIKEVNLFILIPSQSYYFR